MAPLTVAKITKPFDIDIDLPGSKSIALRQLAICALTEEQTTLRGIPPCDDTEAMLDCLGQLGLNIERKPGVVTLQGPMKRSDDVVLNARMSGASTRLLIGLAALRSGQTKIDGHSSLQVRTNAPLLETLKGLGCIIAAPAHGGLPVTISGGPIAGGQLTIDGSLSSQYITALLIALPSLNQNSLLEITGNLVSKPYIDITINEMAKRGAHARWRDERTIEVFAGGYHGGEHHVEGDATAATYATSLATLHRSRVRLNNLGSTTHQGDYQFLDVLEKIGASVRRDQAFTLVEGPEQLANLGSIDMTEMPDAALTLIAMSPLLPGETRITGLSSLHHKECDRLECPARELRQMGIEVETRHDSFTTQAVTPAQVKAHQLTTYHDHRMAMAFSVLGSATGSITIDDERVVDKTYPAYWHDYGKTLGGRVSATEDGNADHD